MTAQYLIVGIIIFAAFAYFFMVIVVRKVISFRSGSKCGGDCACDSESKNLIQSEKSES